MTKNKVITQLKKAFGIHEEWLEWEEYLKLMDMQQSIQQFGGEIPHNFLTFLPMFSTPNNTTPMFSTPNNTTPKNVLPHTTRTTAEARDSLKHKLLLYYSNEYRSGACVRHRKIRSREIRSRE